MVAAAPLVQRRYSAMAIEALDESNFNAVKNW